MNKQSRFFKTCVNIIKESIYDSDIEHLDNDEQLLINRLSNQLSTILSLRDINIYDIKKTPGLSNDFQKGLFIVFIGQFNSFRNKQIELKLDVLYTINEIKCSIYYIVSFVDFAYNPDLTDGIIDQGDINFDIPINELQTFELSKNQFKQIRI